MAKKKKGSPRTSMADTIRANAAAAAESPVGRERDFNPDYSDVVKDLKHIGILAVSFLVIMVALSFVL